MVRNSARGQKVARSLMSHAVSAVIADGLVPKCRVAEENVASVAVATGLGFKKRSALLVWKLKN